MTFKKQLERFGRAFVPERFRDPLHEYLLKAGFWRVPYELFGFLFFGAVAITYALFLPISTYFLELPPVSLFLATLGFWVLTISALVALVMFFIWTFLSLRIYGRTKQMEDALPDYLSLVVTNLRSGMSFDKSLWAAIRPEFGVLGREVTLVSKKVMTGNDTGEALSDFAMRYDSPTLRRSVNLIISEIESGGEIAGVIERVIDNLRRTQQLKKEMAASVVSYMIFISVIVAGLAPILFALANTILQVIIGFAEQIAAAQTSSAALGGGGGLISSFGSLAETQDVLITSFHRFSFLALGTIGLFAGMIVSIIEKGDIRGGLKYIPVFITIALILYIGAREMLGLMFSGLL